MKRLYDVCLARKNAKGEFVKTKEGKNVYDNHGVIVEDDKGYKSLVLRTFQGEVWFTLFENKPKEQQAQPTGDIDGDDIPF